MQMDSIYNDPERKPKDEIKSICVAVRDYTPQRQYPGYRRHMMTFREGDKFVILDNSDAFGLWHARSLSTKRQGWIPSSYVKPETEL